MLFGDLTKMSGEQNTDMIRRCKHQGAPHTVYTRPPASDESDRRAPGTPGNGSTWLSLDGTAGKMILSIIVAFAGPSRLNRGEIWWRVSRRRGDE